MSGTGPNASEVAAAVRAARGGGLDPHDLLWVATPTALFNVESAAASRPWAQAAAATLLTSVSDRRGSRAQSVGDVVFAYEGANPGATLEPVVSAYAAARGLEVAPRHARPRLRHLVGGLRATRAALAAVEAQVGPVPALETALQAAVRAGARADRLLERAAPALVVVATQHSTASRALILAARRRATATAYLPHAPVADTYQYRDLPTDFAGLRGPREVDFYRAIGVRGELSVVGNPQAEVHPPASIDPEAPVIFAPRPQPPDVVRAQVAQVAAAADDVVVSLHPRMRDRGDEPLWPAHWQQHAGRTIELLADGHPCTIQSSSGVAWESLAHGVPVVELGRPPAAYALIQEPYVPTCDSVDALVAAVQQARVAATDPEARQRLMGWARQWCEHVGVDAAARAATWVGDCRQGATHPPGPLLDAWSGAEAAA